MSNPAKGMPVWIASALLILYFCYRENNFNPLQISWTLIFVSNFILVTVDWYQNCLRVVLIVAVQKLLA
jgi:hypothetical protein